jgi:type VI secretion system secreted protein Hcp
MKIIQNWKSRMVQSAPLQNPASFPMKNPSSALFRNLLVCLLPLLIATTARAQVEIFAVFQKNGVYLPGSVEGPDIGEANVVKAIPIQSVSFAIENATTIGSTSGGAGSGKAKFKEMQFSKLVDNTTPTIFNYLSSGQHFDTVTLFFRKPVNGTKVTFMKVAFKLVFLTSTSLATSSGDSDLSESVTAAYGAQQIAFYPNAGNPNPGPPIIQSWSQVLNNPTFETE